MIVRQLLFCCYFIEMLFIHYQWFKLNFVQVLCTRVYNAFRISRKFFKKLTRCKTPILVGRGGMFNQQDKSLNHHKTSKFHEKHIIDPAVTEHWRDKRTDWYTINICNCCITDNFGDVLKWQTDEPTISTFVYGVSSYSYVPIYYNNQRSKVLSHKELKFIA